LTVSFFGKRCVAGEKLSIPTPVAKKPTGVAGATGKRLELSTFQIVQKLLLNTALCQKESQHQINKTSVEAS
jgi:hypothetical protein